MKRKIFLPFIIIVLLFGFYIANSEKTDLSFKIHVNSPLDDYNNNSENSLLLPHYDVTSNRGWQIDLRGKDLSKLSLINRQNDLLNADFDTRTIWPKDLPQGFDPNKILKLSMNPGLKIKELHRIGITGKDVGIAIIDGWMPKKHIEYSQQLEMYVLHTSVSSMAFHGSAVTSIAIGKNTGVAPDARLYYIGASNFNNGKADFTSYANAIREIIEINKKLDNKIRVISISAAWTPDDKGYVEINNAIKEAFRENIFVISPNLFEIYANSICFHGIEVDALADRDEINNYIIVPWDKWIYMANNSTNFGDYYEKYIDKNTPSQILLIPIGCKTVASQTGNSDYTYLRTSGWSWAVPYLAGLYVLGCQVKPDLSPEEFLKATLETGETRSVDINNLNISGKVVNPIKFIEELKNKKI